MSFYVRVGISGNVPLACLSFLVRVCMCIAALFDWEASICQTGLVYIAPVTRAPSQCKRHDVDSSFAARAISGCLVCIACSFKGTHVKTLHRQIAASRTRKGQLWQQKFSTMPKMPKAGKQVLLHHTLILLHCKS